MSKIFIEDYKGQTIEYDINADKFTCEISVEDKSKSTKRQSLAAVRKEIDLFIKTNLQFKPFKVVELKWGGLVVKMVEAIRTDGSFVVRGLKKGDSANFVNPTSMVTDYRKYDSELMTAYEESYKRHEKIREDEVIRHGKVKELTISKLKSIDLSIYNK